MDEVPTLFFSRAQEVADRASSTKENVDIYADLLIPVSTQTTSKESSVEWRLEILERLTKRQELDDTMRDEMLRIPIIRDAVELHRQAKEAIDPRVRERHQHTIINKLTEYKQELVRSVTNQRQCLPGAKDPGGVSTDVTSAQSAGEPTCLPGAKDPGDVSMDAPSAKSQSRVSLECPQSDEPWPSPVSSISDTEEVVAIVTDEDATAECSRNTLNCKEKPCTGVALETQATSYVDLWTWEFEQNGAWVLFDPSDSRIVEEMHERWNSHPKNIGSKRKTRIGRDIYEIDFVRMEQRNLRTNKRRRLNRSSGSNIEASSTCESRCEQEDSHASEYHEMEHVKRQLTQMTERLIDVETIANQVPLLTEKMLSLEKQLQAKEKVISNLRCQLLFAKATARETKKSVESIEDELEVWRHQVIQPIRIFPHEHLIPDACTLLRALVPESHHGPCNKMRCANVNRVEKVASIKLWKTYAHHRQIMIEELAGRQDLPDISKIACVGELKKAFPQITLESKANEVLLLHGTTRQKADDIVRQGFDERLGTRSFYGKGVYFTTESCKAQQYCGDGDDHVMILARVLLGHPFSAVGPMPSQERPPLHVASGAPHDSIIAKPGIPKGKGKGKQLHWEFVVGRGNLQAYPEFLIGFSA